MHNASARSKLALKREAEVKRRTKMREIEAKKREAKVKRRAEVREAQAKKETKRLNRASIKGSKQKQIVLLIFEPRNKMLSFFLFV